MLDNILFRPTTIDYDFIIIKEKQKLEEQIKEKQKLEEAREIQEKLRILNKNPFLSYTKNKLEKKLKFIKKFLTFSDPSCYYKYFSLWFLEMEIKGTGIVSRKKEKQILFNFIKIFLLIISFIIKKHLNLNLFIKEFKFFLFPPKFINNSILEKFIIFNLN